MISTYRAPLEEVLPLEEAHMAWVAEAYASGRILVSGPRVPLNGGVLVVRGTDTAEIEQWMAADPFVHAGLLGFEVHEFAVKDFPYRSVALDLFLNEARV